MKNVVLNKYPTDGVIRAYVVRHGGEALVRIFDEHGKLNKALTLPAAEVDQVLEDHCVEKRYNIKG